jgi:hypothetical protein
VPRSVSETTVKDLREKIIAELTDVGINEPDPIPVEVWTQRSGREFKIVDVIFDDGVISIEVEEVT